MMETSPRHDAVVMETAPYRGPVSRWCHAQSAGRGAPSHRAWRYGQHGPLERGLSWL
jgi:hypothetical protein